MGVAGGSLEVQRVQHVSSLESGVVVLVRALVEHIHHALPKALEPRWQVIHPLLGMLLQCAPSCEHLEVDEKATWA